MNILITGCYGQLGNELKFIFENKKSDLNLKTAKFLI